MSKESIIEAYCHIRKTDNTVPDDVLDFMKDSALAAIEVNSLSLTRDDMLKAYNYGVEMSVDDAVLFNNWYYDNYEKEQQREREQ